MKLKEYIDNNGLKQTWMAEKLGVSLSTFNNVVNEVYRPSPDLAASIERLTGIDARELLGIPKQQTNHESGTAALLDKV